MIKKRIKNNLIKIFLLTLFGLLVAGVSFFVINDFKDILIFDFRISLIFFLIVMFFIIILVSYFFIMNKRDKGIFESGKLGLDFLIKWRYLILLTTFILLVSLGINFSSISTWNQIFYENENIEGSSEVIFGKERKIRSDEWLVQSPWILSQYWEDYPSENMNIRVDGQNMLLLGTKPPIKHISIVGYPYNWGYLFLPIEQGFSWNWISKLFLIIIFSYEFLYIITKKNKYVSFLGAFWIAFSGDVSWWFSTAIVELIIASQAIFVGIYYYFNHNKWLFKIGAVMVINIFAINFILNLYPPLQIPLGYLTLSLILILFIKNRKDIKKEDIYLILGSLILISFVVACTIVPSLDAIQIMTNTSYPGKRFINAGGVSLTSVSVNNLTNWLLPFEDVPGSFANNCEAAAFVTFMPVTILVLLKNLKAKIFDNAYLKGLLISFFLGISWLIIPFPEIIAKTTLMYMVTPANTMLVIGLASVYISCIVLSGVSNESRKFSNLQIGAFCVLLCTYYIFVIYRENLSLFLGVGGIVVILLLTFLGNVFFLKNKKLAFAFIICFISILPGVLVNPIERNLEPLLENNVAIDIQTISQKDDEALWMGYNNLMISDFALAQGVKVINSVHNYPNNKIWGKLSTKEKDFEIYNRFAHIEIVFGSNENNESYFEYVDGDWFRVHLTIEDLKKLDIKYIVSAEDLTVFNEESVTFERINPVEERNFGIYEVMQIK